MAQMSETLQKVQTLVLCSLPSGHGAARAGGGKTSHVESREPAECLVGRVQTGVTREKL